MRVSVVVCIHTLDRYDAFREAARSVLDQTHEDTELVLVSDGSEAVFGRFHEEFGDREDVICYRNDENLGLLESRNNGARAATGDVVAFLDDDAVADPEWVATLVDAYEREGAVAVGGKMTPEWVAGKPGFLPSEFYFLIGVTQRGFADGPGEVRNTFGSNISFQREVFLELGGFDAEIGGRKGDRHLQGGETELCARMRESYGEGVYYDPDARVAHKVFDYRTDPVWLAKRAFWQGYSKRGMEVLVPASTGEESEFLSKLLLEFVPDRIAGLLREPSQTKALQLFALFALTACVGLGYGYGFTKWR